MTIYTVEIQVSNADGSIWQAVEPAENVEDDGGPDEVAMDVAYTQNVAEGAGWRVRVWIGADVDTATDPDGEYAVPLGTTIEDLADAIATEREIPRAAADALVRTYVDQINDENDLWHRAAQILTTAGEGIVRDAIEAAYQHELTSTSEGLMLTELADTVTAITEHTERRDELVRTLMGTSVARSQIAAAAGLTEGRLYQIRDARTSCQIG